MTVKIGMIIKNFVQKITLHKKPLLLHWALHRRQFHAGNLKAGIRI